MFVEPVGQLSDSKTEDYDFRATVPLSEPTPALMADNTTSDHVVVVRVYDRYDNLAHCENRAAREIAANSSRISLLINICHPERSEGSAVSPQDADPSLRSG